MYTRRATLVTLNSLRALSNVRILRPLNSLNFSRTLSIATARSDFYNGGNVENHSEYVYGNQQTLDNSKLPSGSCQDWNFEQSNASNPQKPHTVVYRQNPGGQSSQFYSDSIDYQYNADTLKSSYGHHQDWISHKHNEESQKNPSMGLHWLKTDGKFLQTSRQDYGGPGNFSTHDSGKVGMFQQNLRGPENCQHMNKFQQNAVRVTHSNGVDYHQSSDGSQNGLAGSEFTNKLNPTEDFAEAAQGSHSEATIEKLNELCKEGKLKEAVEVLVLLEQQNVCVGLPQYMKLMEACGDNKALEEAKSVHQHLMRSISYVEVQTNNKILEMYSKCGSMADAFRVFDQMPTRNMTSWDTMITWLAKNGHADDAIELFEEFKRCGLKPDGQMFIGVFFACGVLGDCVEGMLHFESMIKDYGIVPSMNHYLGIVDMFGSSGYLNEALEFIDKMPEEPSFEIWETLMNLSRVHGNLELGDHFAELLELLDPSRLDEQSRAGLLQIKASDLAKEKERKKLSGANLLEARSRVHEYRAGDRSHPEHEKIYALLKGMKEQMKEAGYIPETKFVLHDIDQESKEEALMAHSERLASAQGLMSTPARSPLRIIKNLRVCVDCHNAMKIMSKLVGRELIARDAKRFHHFKDGVCSCNDYW